jgi:hypothetical protein
MVIVRHVLDGGCLDSNPLQSKLRCDRSGEGNGRGSLICKYVSYNGSSVEKDIGEGTESQYKVFKMAKIPIVFSSTTSAVR